MPNDGYDFELENGISTECEAYLQYLRKARLRPQEFEAVYSEFLNLEDFLRLQSISVYFSNIQQADNTASRNMKELSGQKSRVVETSYFWDLKHCLCLSQGKNFHKNQTMTCEPLQEIGDLSPRTTEGKVCRVL